jgi:hypothetical protein
MAIPAENYPHCAQLRLIPACRQDGPPIASARQTVGSRTDAHQMSWICANPSEFPANRLHENLSLAQAAIDKKWTSAQRCPTSYNSIPQASAVFTEIKNTYVRYL